jgi:hypothetical protein
MVSAATGNRKSGRDRAGWMRTLGESAKAARTDMPERVPQGGYTDPYRPSELAIAGVGLLSKT